MLALTTRLHALLRWSERYTKTDMVYLASGGFWLVLGQSCGAFLALLLAIAFGHIASQDTYGNYKYAITLAGLFGTFALSGLGTGIIQSVSRGYDGTLRQGFRLNLQWSWGIVLLSFAAAGYYYFSSHNLFLVFALCLIGIFSPLINSFSLFSTLLTGQKQFKRETLYSIINGALPVLAVIATLLVTQRAIILVTVYLVSNLLADAYFYLLALRQERNRQEDPELFSYSAHLSVMGIVNAIADKIDSIVVFTFLGPIQLAVYAYAIAMPEQLKQVMKQVVPLSMTKFSSRSISEIQQTIWPKLGYLAAGFSALLLLYIAAAPSLFHFLFPVYTSAISYSQLYALTLVLSFLSTPFMAVFQAHKNVREQYITSGASSVVLLIALPILTYFFGIVGAIGSQFIYRFFSAGISLFYFLRLKEPTGSGYTTPHA